jgi:hypothetical protein
MPRLASRGILLVAAAAVIERSSCRLRLRTAVAAALRNLRTNIDAVGLTKVDSVARIPNLLVMSALVRWRDARCRPIDGLHGRSPVTRFNSLENLASENLA